MSSLFICVCGFLNLAPCRISKRDETSWQRNQPSPVLCWVLPICKGSPRCTVTKTCASGLWRGSVGSAGGGPRGPSLPTDGRGRGHNSVMFSNMLAVNSASFLTHTHAHILYTQLTDSWAAPLVSKNVFSGVYSQPVSQNGGKGEALMVLL